VSKNQTNTERFFDGCHRYGWIISILATALLNGIMLAYFVGGQTQRIDDLKSEVEQRVGRIEQQMDNLIRLNPPAKR